MKAVKVLDMTGKVVSERNLNESVFNVEPSEASVHMVVVNHLARCRQGTQSTLTRSEVSGGGRKPWRQKGTGHARQGSTRSPQWVHGGVALGPKPRTYGFSINKKVRVKAMKSVLSSKVKDGELVLVDSISMKEIKTKKFIEFMNAIKVEGKALFVLPKVENEVRRSANNLEGVKTEFVGELNVYDILKYDKLVLDVGALEKIEEVYGKNA